jgi:hypothetical protein
LVFTQTQTPRISTTSSSANTAKASAAILDLPYNLPIAGFVSGLGKKTHRKFAMASGEMTPAQFTNFLAEAIEASLNGEGAVRGDQLGPIAQDAKSTICSQRKPFPRSRVDHEISESS